MTTYRDPLEDANVPPVALSLGTIVAIFIGGALGTVARFLLTNAFPHSSGHFPTITLVINLSGSLAIGLLVPAVERLRGRSRHLRPFVVVGLLGGWTTYSTFAVDADTLIKNGHAATGVLYVAATLIGGLALVLIGSAGARWVTT